MYLPTLNEDHSTFHLQYNHSGTFANRKYGELSYPKNQKMCYPILVTLLEMRPHYNQSSHENETPSCSTSPLASYKEVSPLFPLAIGHRFASPVHNVSDMLVSVITSTCISCNISSMRHSVSVMKH